MESRIAAVKPPLQLNWQKSMIAIYSTWMISSCALNSARLNDFHRSVVTWTMSVLQRKC